MSALRAAFSRYSRKTSWCGQNEHPAWAKCNLRSEDAWRGEPLNTLKCILLRRLGNEIRMEKISSIFNSSVFKGIQVESRQCQFSRRLSCADFR